MKVKRPICFLAAAVLLGGIGQLAVDRTVFSSAAARQAVLIAKSNSSVKDRLGVVRTASVAERLEFANGPDWRRRERFVVRVAGSKGQGLVTVERVLATNEVAGDAFHVTRVESH